MREEAQKMAPKKLVMNRRTWFPYGQNYRVPGFATIASETSAAQGICFLTGLASGYDTSQELATLPADCRPSETVAFDVHLSRCETAQFNINSKGLISWKRGAQRSGGNLGHWMALSMISFSVSGTVESKLILKAPWVDFGQEYQGARLRWKDGLCSISGMIGTSDGKVYSMRPQIATLEPKCHPKDGVVSFSINSGENSGMVEIHPNGTIWLVRLVPRQNSFISLSTMMFVTGTEKETPLNAMKLLDGWIPFNDYYRRPSWTRSDTVCIISGRARREGGMRSNITQVAEECRPDARLVFYTQSAFATVRLDVHPDGVVEFVEAAQGETNPPWVSFDGLRWVLGAPQ